MVKRKDVYNKGYIYSYLSNSVPKRYGLLIIRLFKNFYLITKYRVLMLKYRLKYGIKKIAYTNYEKILSFGSYLKVIAGKIFHNFLKRYAPVFLVFLSILIYAVLFPSPYTMPSEDKPYYGNFAWKSLTIAKLSPGDFRENGRGGLELKAPKLRLIEYTVKPGDTLWGIAGRFGLDPDSIISCNSFSNVHKLMVGDRILIPNIRGIFVSVKEGDTIYKISAKYKVSPEVVMEVNNLDSPILAPGMKIFLPGVRFNIMERAFALGEAFEKPARGRLTSRFGYRRDPFTRKISFHTGIDIANRPGTAIHAARDGIVTFVGLKSGYGLVVIIKHKFGYKTVYGHLLSSRVKRGQRVKKGQIIGFMGNSGRSTGPHLHFEVWLNSRLVDPLTQTNMTVR